MTAKVGAADARRGSVPRPANEPSAVARRRSIDNLKVVMIAAIIAGHGFLGYAAVGGAMWSYAEVQEVTLSPVTDSLLIVLAGPLALVLVPLFFLVAGLLTPASLERKGAPRFMRDRLLRLGLPFVAFVFVLWPAFMHLVFDVLLESSPATWWDRVIGADGTPDTGPLWFVGVLLIFSLAYGAWSWIRPRQPGAGSPDLGRPHLLGLAAAVALTTFVVRLVYAFGTDTVGDLNLWQWPACSALFGLGIVGAGCGWLDAVSDRLARQARATATVAAGAVVVLVVGGGAVGIGDDLWGGWRWPALLMATLEAGLAVFGSVWLLSVAQRRLDRPMPFGHLIVRSAYLAFILQGFVLIALALALRPMPAAAEIKALIVAVGGVAASFALAALLVTRVRLLADVVGS